MAIAEWIAAIQTNGKFESSTNPPAAGYFVIVLAVVVVGLMVWIFIRTNASKSSSHAGRPVVNEKNPASPRLRDIPK
jgi:hypothetical protein